MIPGRLGAESSPVFDAAIPLTVFTAATIGMWWTLTDRLDLPKLAVLVAGAAGVLAWSAARRRVLAVDEVCATLAGVALLALAVSPIEMSARVEGWAGLVAALVVVAAARRASPGRIARGLGWIAAATALLAWLQVLGVPLFNAEVTGFGGRRALGTLGSPGHLGWVLAALLPWLGRAQLDPRLRGGLLALVVSAIVLTGARTAWVMALVTIPLWLDLQHWKGLAAGLGAGVVLGVVGGLASSELAGRTADLMAATGTAAGRVHLWRVHLSSFPGVLTVAGHGPESFARLWPGMQDAYFAAHAEAPDVLRSDLRHAHADAYEVLVDFGLAGVGVLVGVVAVALRRGWRGAAPASLIAVLVGGLASPLLPFAPIALLAAIALGVCLGPVRRARPALTIVCALAVVAAAVPLGRRVASEVVRADATRARIAGDLGHARRTAERAVFLDRRNPRAWMETAMACSGLGEDACAIDAIQRVEHDLPTDSVRSARKLLLSTP